MKRSQRVRVGVVAAVLAAAALGPWGPRVAIVTVPAGGESVGTLIQNEIPWVTVNGVANLSPGGDSLSVAPTAQYPTPAT